PGVRRRRAARLSIARGGHATAAATREAYEYQGKQTCAADGMCQVACPVDINTGDLVPRLRGEDAGAVEKAAWGPAAAGWDTLTRGASSAISAAGTMPRALPRAATDVGRALLGRAAVPQYQSELPRTGRAARPA